MQHPLGYCICATCTLDRNCHFDATFGRALGQEREEAAEKVPQWLGKRRIDTVHLAHSQNQDSRISLGIFGLQQPGPLDHQK